jgi:hypothetical protein
VTHIIILLCCTYLGDIAPLTVLYKVVKSTMKQKQRSNRIHRNSRVTKRVSQRSLHLRIAFHPINALFLLCAGILLASSTINAIADSYTITAIVPAVPLTQAATITSHSDHSIILTQSISVKGACPTSSYVKLTNNGQYSGTSNCKNNNTFQVGLDLNPGNNVLYAQDYNSTDTPGPAGTPVTVQYIPPAPSTPPVTTSTATPVVLQILHDDTSVAYSGGGESTPAVSDRPTFTGIAPPYSTVTVVVHSNPYTCITTASNQGYWQCTISSTLPATLHEVDVSAKTTGGQTLTFPRFKIQVVSSSPAPQIPPSAKLQLTLGSSSALNYIDVGQKLTYGIATIGGTSPSAVSVDWGDGSSSAYLSKDATPFAITHTYGWVNNSSQTVTIKIQAVDASGAVSSLQLAAVLKNPNFTGVVSATSSPGGLKGILEDIKPWLWLFWPGYAIVLLAVFSFWLGERQEQLELRHKSKPRRKLHHAGHTR